MKKFLVCGLFALSACSVGLGDGKKDSKKNDSQVSKSEKISYELEENGCKTGRQEFDSKSAFCEGLKSQSRNNYCAVSLREQTYKNAGCPGNFETTK